METRPSYRWNFRAVLLYMVRLLALFPFPMAESGTFEEKICQGRVLTTREDVESLNKENCTTIEGPLFIENLGPGNCSSLDTVEHITQFLVVQRIRANCTCLHQLLPKLKIIRGHHLYDDRWTLVMRGNIRLNIGDEQYDVLESASKKLNKTSVYIENLLNATCHSTDHDNSRFIEAVSNPCWKSNYTDSNGKCHHSCPDRTVVVEGWRCAKSCGNLTVAKFNWQMKEAEVETVPGINVSASCLASCKAPAGVVRDVSQLQYLQGCVVLEGNLGLSLTVSTMDMYLLEKYLQSLEEIRGYLLIFRSWGMNSLQFLKNLTKLNPDGKLWLNRYALALYDNPDLEQLWDKVNSLTVCCKGELYLQGNPRLCFHNVEALKQSFSRPIIPDLGQNDTCDPLELSVMSNNLHWVVNMQYNMRVIGQFVYQISLRKINITNMCDPLSEFEQWMAEKGSPGDLKGWRVREIDSKTTNVPIAKDQDQIYHIRVFGISGKGKNSKYKELRSRIFFQPSNSAETASVTRCQSSQSLKQTVGVLAYSICCLSKRNSSDYPTVHVRLKSLVLPVMNDEVHVEVKELQEISSASPYTDTPLIMKKDRHCFANCHGIFQNYDDSVIPRRVTVETSTPCNNCSGDCSVYTYSSKELDIDIPGLKPNTNYALRARKKRLTQKSTCGPWNSPVLIQTPPSEEVDMPQNLTVDKDNDCNFILSWDSPDHPNGGQVDYFCLAVYGCNESQCQFIDESITGNELDSCYTSLGINCSRPDNECVIAKTTVINDTTNFEVKLNIMKQLKSRKQLKFQVQTASHIKWRDGRAVQTGFSWPCKLKDSTDDSAMIAGVVVCCVVIIVLISLLVYAVKYGRGKRKEAVDLQNKIYYLHSISDFPTDEDYQPDEWEVDAECIMLHNALGEGAFGKVYSGTLLCEKKEVPVAVKTLKDGATSVERIVFLQESSMMKKLDSDNVVRLLGIVSKTDPVYVLMELMPNGDLKHYLQSIRPKGDRNEDGSYSYYPLVEDDLIHMALQIAAGMQYLHSQRFVHRDLAARNCMVAENPKVIKVGDFGMARDVYSTDYYVKRGRGPMPIRWMAPESLQDGIFTFITDVWSYGIVLWEMVTLGSQPYPGKTNQEVFDLVINGQVMDVKSLPHCPPIFVTTMERCWTIEPQQRPEFQQILAALSVDHGEESRV